MKLRVNGTSDHGDRSLAFSTSTNLKGYFPTLIAGTVGVGHIYLDIEVFGSCWRRLHIGYKHQIEKNTPSYIILISIIR